MEIFDFGSKLAHAYRGGFSPSPGGCVFTNRYSGGMFWPDKPMACWGDACEDNHLGE